MVIGIWFLADDRVVHFIGVASDHGTMAIIQAAAGTVLVVGFFSLVIGAIGCWGACRQKISLLVIVSITVCLFASFVLLSLCLQCFDAVGWAAGRASGL